MEQEIELKLSVPPDAAVRLWRTNALAAFPRSKPVTRRLYSAYYDTPARDLVKRGVALRLRREGKRWIQTLKGGGPAASGLHLRNEIDTEVAAQLVSFPALIEAGLADLVEDPDFRASLGVVFTTDFTRVSAEIETAQGERVEISLDRGEIASGERRQALCEIELELKSGRAAHLFDLAAALAAELPLRLDNVSKAERGYRLADDAPAAPVKASIVTLLDGMDVDAAFRAIAAGCLRHLQANERGVLESTDPEYVHQARVAIRRLRSAFSLFRRAVPKAHFSDSLTWLKDVARTLGAARDWDVFCTELLPRARAASAATQIRPIAQRASAARNRSRRHARAALAQPDYTRRSLAFARMLVEGGWPQTGEPAPADAVGMPLRDYAAGELSRRDAKVRKRGARLDRANPASLHTLRIEIKKLRYACEFFGPLFGRKPLKRYLSRLQDLQAILGSVNDAATASRLLDALAAHNNDPAYQQGIGFLRGFAAASAEQQLGGLAQAWDRFARAEPFW
jgi:inorganic triphosphatase YgiF